MCYYDSSIMGQAKPRSESVDGNGKAQPYSQSGVFNLQQLAVQHGQRIPAFAIGEVFNLAQSTLESKNGVFNVVAESKGGQLIMPKVFR